MPTILIAFWSAIKRIYPSKTKTSRTEKVFNVKMGEIDNELEIANVCTKHFSIIASSLETAVYPLTSFTCHTQVVLQS